MPAAPAFLVAADGARLALRHWPVESGRRLGVVAISHGLDSDNARAVAVNEQSCRLGKWLGNSETVAIFGNVGSFRRIGDPHRTVHQSMHRAMELLATGWETDYAIQEKLHGAFEKVEAGSDGVIDSLDAMVREKHGNR